MARLERPIFDAALIWYEKRQRIEKGIAEIRAKPGNGSPSDPSPVSKKCVVSAAAPKPIAAAKEEAVGECRKQTAES
jgi:hypothetical protein